MRRSSGAYAMLAGAVGVLKELPRQSFEEKETVWVFEQGEVMPRRATVLEVTAQEWARVACPPIISLSDCMSEIMLWSSVLCRV